MAGNWSDQENHETTWPNNGNLNGNIYTINNAKELAQFAFLVNNGTSYSGSTVKLAGNIELAGNDWTPIGVQDGNVFLGTFDGNGKTIANMKVEQISLNSSSGIAGGFFRHLVSSNSTYPTVKNIRFTNVDVYVQGAGTANPNQTYAGAVVGQMGQGTVENCFVESGTVLAKSTSATGIVYIGGIAGAHYNLSSNATTIRNCVNGALVKVEGTGYLYVGGIEGYMYDGFIQNCLNMGSVQGPTQATYQTCLGGILGYASRSVGANADKVENCFNTGAITASAGPTSTTRVGALIGAWGSTFRSSTIASNSYWKSGTASAVYGLTDDFSPANTVLSVNTPPGTFSSTHPTSNSTDLLATLNNWVTSKGSAFLGWSVIPSINGGYPILTEIAAMMTSTLTVDTTEIEFPASGDDTTITIETNASWTAVSSDPSWLTVTPESGTGNADITIIAQPNTTIEPREGMITIIVTIGTDMTVEVITVTQAGAEPTLSISTENEEVPYTKGDFTVTVESNTTWTVGTDDDWLAVIINDDGTFTVIYAENEGAEREGTITVTVDGKTKTIKVTQQADPYRKFGDWIIGDHANDETEEVEEGTTVTITEPDGVIIGEGEGANDNTLVVNGKLRSKSIRVGGTGNHGNKLVVGENGDIGDVEDIYLYPGNTIEFEKPWTNEEDLFEFLGDANLWVWDPETADWVKLDEENWRDHIDICDLDPENPKSGMLVKYKDAEPEVIEPATITSVTVSGTQVTLTASSDNTTGYYAIWSATNLLDTTWTYTGVTGTFDADGNFSATFAKNGEQRFYRVLTSDAMFDTNGETTGVKIYSTNVGGYYTATLPAAPAVAYITNQFNQLGTTQTLVMTNVFTTVAKNSVAALFDALPAGTRVVVDSTPMSKTPVGWETAAATTLAVRGQELLAYLPSGSASTSFVISGTLEDGDGTTRTIPANANTFTCSSLPLSGTPQAIGIPIASGDVVNQMVDGVLLPRTNTPMGWSPACTIKLGEAFIFRPFTTGRAWNQTLTIPEGRLQLTIE